ncbi:FK506-binding protein 5-like [Neocloeon triangulifer]|uniref:FK506-binding protein 5-like n=1 Tax=Neocloeon triangulifer TaxID=2078957 RepID=UPI00286F0C7F|nr:FK506-binding protein 5-like [Neocloeon triangulifer]
MLRPSQLLLLVTLYLNLGHPEGLPIANETQREVLRKLYHKLRVDVEDFGIALNFTDHIRTDENESANHEGTNSGWSFRSVVDSIIGKEKIEDQHKEQTTEKTPAENKHLVSDTINDIINNLNEVRDIVVGNNCSENGQQGENNSVTLLEVPNKAGQILEIENMERREEEADRNQNLPVFEKSSESSENVQQLSASSETNEQNFNEVISTTESESVAGDNSAAVDIVINENVPKRGSEENNVEVEQDTTESTSVTTEAQVESETEQNYNEEEESEIEVTTTEWPFRASFREIGAQLGLLKISSRPIEENQPDRGFTTESSVTTAIYGLVEKIKSSLSFNNGEDEEGDKKEAEKIEIENTSGEKSARAGSGDESTETNENSESEADGQINAPEYATTESSAHPQHTESKSDEDEIETTTIELEVTTFPKEIESANFAASFEKITPESKENKETLPKILDYTPERVFEEKKEGTEELSIEKAAKESESEIQEHNEMNQEKALENNAQLSETRENDAENSTPIPRVGAKETSLAEENSSKTSETTIHPQAIVKIDILSGEIITEEPESSTTTEINAEEKGNISESGNTTEGPTSAEETEEIFDGKNEYDLQITTTENSLSEEATTPVPTIIIKSDGKKIDNKNRIQTFSADSESESKESQENEVLVTTEAIPTLSGQKTLALENSEEELENNNSSLETIQEETESELEKLNKTESYSGEILTPDIIFAERERVALEESNLTETDDEQKEIKSVEKSEGRDTNDDLILLIGHRDTQMENNIPGTTAAPNSNVPGAEEDQSLDLNNRRIITHSEEIEYLEKTQTVEKGQTGATDYDYEPDGEDEEGKGGLGGIISRVETVSERVKDVFEELLEKQKAVKNSKGESETDEGKSEAGTVFAQVTDWIEKKLEKPEENGTEINESGSEEKEIFGGIISEVSVTGEKVKSAIDELLDLKKVVEAEKTDNEQTESGEENNEEDKQENEAATEYSNWFREITETVKAEIDQLREHEESREEANNRKDENVLVSNLETPGNAKEIEGMYEDRKEKTSSETGSAFGGIATWLEKKLEKTDKDITESKESGSQEKEIFGGIISEVANTGEKVKSAIDELLDLKKAAEKESEEKKEGVKQENEAATEYSNWFREITETVNAEIADNSKEHVSREDKDENILVSNLETPERENEEKDIREEIIGEQENEGPSIVIETNNTASADEKISSWHERKPEEEVKNNQKNKSEENGILGGIISAAERAYEKGKETVVELLNSKESEGNDRIKSEEIEKEVSDEKIINGEQKSQEQENEMPIIVPTFSITSKSEEVEETQVENTDANAVRNPGVDNFREMEILPSTANAQNEAEKERNNNDEEKIVIDFVSKPSKSESSEILAASDNFANSESSSKNALGEIIITGKSDSAEKRESGEDEIVIVPAVVQNEHEAAAKKGEDELEKGPGLTDLTFGMKGGGTNEVEHTVPDYDDYESVIAAKPDETEGKEQEEQNSSKEGVGLGEVTKFEVPSRGGAIEETENIKYEHNLGSNLISPGADNVEPSMLSMKQFHDNKGNPEPRVNVTFNAPKEKGVYDMYIDRKGRRCSEFTELPLDVEYLREVFVNSGFSNFQLPSLGVNLNELADKAVFFKDLDDNSILCGTLTINHR